MDSITNAVLAVTFSVLTTNVIQEKPYSDYLYDKHGQVVFDGTNTVKQQRRRVITYVLRKQVTEFVGTGVVVTNKGGTLVHYKMERQAMGWTNKSSIEVTNYTRGISTNSVREQMSLMVPNGSLPAWFGSSQFDE